MKTIIIPIDKEYRQQLESLLETIKKELALEKAERQNFSKITSNLEKLTAEVLQLEKAFDGTDLQTLEKLTAKQSQVATMTAKVAEFGDEGKISQTRWATWTRLMLECNTAFRPYYSSFRTNVEEQVEDAIRPFLQDSIYRQGTLAHIVQQTHILSHADFWCSQLSTAGDPRGCVVRFVEIFQKALAGGEIWTFDSGPKVPIAKKTKESND